MSETEVVIYLLVRQDLKMSKGKIVAQCCHAVQDLILACEVIEQYIVGEHPKIALKIKDL